MFKRYRTLFVSLKMGNHHSFLGSFKLLKTCLDGENVLSTITKPRKLIL